VLQYIAGHNDPRRTRARMRRESLCHLEVAKNFGHRYTPNALSRTEADIISA
jgi:hypothetical protein